MVKTLKYSFGSVYVQCHNASHKLGFEIINEDLETGVITFEVPGSLWSFGEKFTLKLSNTKLTETVIEIDSKSSIGLQIVAWGKNDRNKVNFLAKLDELLNP